MITLEFKNIKLQLIAKNDIEMIRQWRNAPHVAEYMKYQSEISEQEQKIWFQSIQNHQHLYFKILVSETPIGVVNLKNIDWKMKEAEAGVFVGRKDFLGTPAPVLSVYFLMKIVFECFRFEKLKAKISNKNLSAIKFNEELGYQFESELNKGFGQYICNRTDFNSLSLSISKIQTLFNKNGPIKIYVDKESDWILPYMDIENGGFKLIRE